MDDGVSVGRKNGVREKDVDSAFWVHCSCPTELKANVGLAFLGVTSDHTACSRT